MPGRRGQGERSKSQAVSIASVNGAAALAFREDRRHSLGLMKAPTMTTLTLIFNGPSSQARVALGGLLQRYRTAYFVERSSNEYAVTADDSTAAELARLPLWSARVTQSPTRR